MAEAEGNPVCRRLQLKDIIPTAMQRLTKYPLLLESLAKYTQPRSEEMTLVRRCLERSREILNKVNQAIKEAENYNRLVDIQRRLDKSAFEKSDHAIANELRVLLMFHSSNYCWFYDGMKEFAMEFFLFSFLSYRYLIYTFLFGISELRTDKASSRLRGCTDVENKRPEEC